MKNYLKDLWNNWSDRSEWHGSRHHKVHRQIKDRLFRFLFEKDRDALLQLYNALNGTEYQDPSMLQVVTIESAVYVVMKNDLAFILAGVLNLYEHQSTVNPNMPVRFLIYLAQEYQGIIEKAKESLYGSRQIMLPTPHCVVFYNGDQEMPEKQTLRLSDAFENKEHKADVELTVKVLNINHGHNVKLMDQCKILEEYARFVDATKQLVAEKDDRKEALESAIEYCIENHILEEFLRKYRSEVLGMLLEEFDVKKYERSLREEGREEGRKIGREEGREEGHKLGREVGREEGRNLTLIRQVHKKYAKNLTVEETSEMLEENPETIRKIYLAIKTTGTNNIDEIYKQYVSFK